ncbi:MAG TPA: LuxR C-terminal-related transcriptional regulator [Solirubrobacteraceae bacterium]|nr:LuxR C-terminal-related transcriptional regulator [Solirubrobacteraceae bacterium]
MSRTETLADERLEGRYLAFAGLASALLTCSDWSRLATAVSRSLGVIGETPPVRLWAMTPDGPSELARHPGDHRFGRLAPGVVNRAAALGDSTEAGGGGLLVGLYADGVTLGVLEVGELPDRELLEQIAPIVGLRFSVLAGRGVGGIAFSPRAIEESGDASAVISQFARQAKRLLDHDRLSVYLITPDGRAFERFAVATSGIVPGEGVLIPFEDVGLRHIVLTNRPLVSEDIAADGRIVGREDRVIAQAGFHSLVSVPLRRDTRPFGLLNFVSRQPGFYGTQDIPVAQQIADQIAAFVEHLGFQRRMSTFIRHEATEWTRARVTRDLYHPVAQATPEIARAASELERMLGDTAAAEQARRIRDLAQFELADIRRAVVDLDPPGLETHTLTEMIELAVERFRERGDATPRLRIQGDTAGLAAIVPRATYRILQETLMNVALHAHATTVDVRLKVDRDLLLTIEDDGVGFDTAAAEQGDGLGLRHMHERAEALGGFLTIESEPAAGTRVALTVPSVRDAVEAAPVSAPQLVATTNGEPTLRVFVAAANALMRAGLCRVLEHDELMRVVGEASTVDELRGQVRRLHPDVIVLATTATSDGVREVLEAIRGDVPNSAVLAVVDGDRRHAREVVDAGASGVVRATTDAGDLVQAVRTVATGTRVVLGDEPSAGEPCERLSAREREILTLLADGRTNAEIGDRLFLAAKTVERHVSVIARKLNARNRAHAAAIGVARQLVLTDMLVYQNAKMHDERRIR